MNIGTIALIIVAISIVAWVLFMANVIIRRQRKAKAAAAADREHPAAAGSATDVDQTTRTEPQVTVEKVPEKDRKPLTPEQLAVSRRQFLNRATTLSFLGFLGLFGMSSLSFLWPRLTGGFGTRIAAGDYDDLIARIGPDGGYEPVFNSEGRFWLTYYEGTGDATVYQAIGAADTQMLALYRKCVHLGCSVPFCSSSKLFECPCHGSKYRLNGEFFAGPAPRGLDRFPVIIEGNTVIVDTGQLEVGPPRGTNTWAQFSEPQGEFCVPT